MKSAFKAWLRHWVHDRATAGAPPNRIPWSHWGYEATAAGMSLHGVPLVHLVKEFGSPLHVLNVDKLLGNLQGFAQGTQDLQPTVCCSVKTYPVPGLLDVLLAHGAQAEVISEHELWLVRRLGVKPEHIIFNGPAKSDAALTWAIEAGVKAIHFNHAEEIERVGAIAARVGKRAKVGFRLTSSGVTGQFGFGVGNPDTLAVVRRVMEHPWLEPVSLHGHRGHHMHSPADVLGHVRPMLAFMQQAHQTLGWQCKVFDVGGSMAVSTVAPLDKRAARLAWTFGVPASAPDTGLTLEPSAYSRLVCAEVKAFCQGKSLALPEVVMEPGRALSANAQALASTVLDTRHDTPFAYAVTDVGTALAPGACGEYHQMGLAHKVNERPSAQTQVYRVVGPICHLGDVATPAWRFPVLSRGDHLLMMDSGAYFISDASSFSFPQPGVVAVHADGRVECLRRAETSQDMVHRDLAGLRNLSWPSAGLIAPRPQAATV